MDCFQINKIIMCDEDGSNFELEYLNNSEMRFILKDGEDEVAMKFTRKDIKKLIKIFDYWLENNKFIDLELIN